MLRLFDMNNTNLLLHLQLNHENYHCDTQKKPHTHT